MQYLGHTENSVSEILHLTGLFVFLCAPLYNPGGDEVNLVYLPNQGIFCRLQVKTQGQCSEHGCPY
jgi:hypothetical protein